MTAIDDTLAQLRRAIDTIADEDLIQDQILSALQDLRSKYRSAPSSFSADTIQYLRRLSSLADAIHEFKDALDDASDSRTKDETIEVLGRFDGLREQMWPPLLAQRLHKEIRELIEKSAALPSSSSLRRDTERKRLVFGLESKAPTCNRCGARMALRETRASAFWGCSTFPTCFSRQWITREQKAALGID